MDEYIKRSKLEFDFKQCNSMNSKWTPQRVLQLIHRQKNEYVAPAMPGYWEGYSHSGYCGINDDGDPIYRDGVVYCCSNCRRKTVIKEKYCPSCGAKMDLEVTHD